MGRYSKEPERPREPPVIAGRVPPHDLDIEACVLSACLLEQGAYDEVADLLTPDGAHFYSDANRIVFQAIGWCVTNGVPVDVETVANRLRGTEQIMRIGGSSYLGQIVDASPAVAHLRRHAKTVHRLFVARRVISTAQFRAAEGYSVRTVEQANQYIDETEQELLKATQISDSNERAKFVRDILIKVFRDIQDGSSMGTPTRLRFYDHFTGGPANGNLYFIAARPGMGKTSAALQIVQGLSEGWRYDAAQNIIPDITDDGIQIRRHIDVFSLEMPKEQLVARHVSQIADVPSGRLRTAGKLSSDDWSSLTAASQRLSMLPIKIDDTPAVNLNYIRSSARRSKVEGERRGTPLGGLLIDYFTLMKGTGNGSREEKVSDNAKGLKGIAKELDIPVIALAQLNRMCETRGGDKRPILSDLRESGGTEEAADHVAMLYRGKYYEREFRGEYTSEPWEAEWIHTKHRHGPTGTAPSRFVERCMRFEDIDGWPENTYREAQEYSGDVY